jgi:phage gp46-like protein
MDIAILWDNTQGQADWGFANGDLVSTAGFTDLQNAVAVSLFTDARADPSFVLWDGDPRGYWGDSYTATPLGSHLWYLDRAKKVGNTQLLLQARDACKQALQWLLDDGIADTVSVSTQWISANAIGISVTITQPSQSNSTTLQYSWAWS